MGKRYRFLHLDRSELGILNAFISRMAVRRKFKVRRRGQAVWLSHKKRTVEQIAEYLSTTPRSVYQWLKLYRERGIDGIAPRDYACKLTSEQIKQLLKVSRRADSIKNLKDYHNRWSFRKMARWVKDNFDIKISYERVRQIVRQKMRE